MVSVSLLAAVDNERLQRSVEGLVSGVYAITVLRNSATEISAIVKNGDGNSYRVTLTESRAFCACKDATYRKIICKHATALALHMIRNPTAAEEKEPNLKLARVRRSQ